MKAKKKIKELEARIEKLESRKRSILDRIFEPQIREVTFTPLSMLKGKALKDIIEKGYFSDSIKDHKKGRY